MSRDPYTVHAVERYCRRTRRTLATLGERMTMDDASALAEEYREADRASEDAADLEAARGYRVVTMPLAEQSEILGGPGVSTGMPKTADDRPAVAGAAALVKAVAEINRLASERDLYSALTDGSDERDRNIGVALRAWAPGALGTVDALCVEVARRRECTVAVARAALYGQKKSSGCLDVAVEIYREHVARQGQPVEA
ncbi:MAG TPA: hypothetical protein VGB53_05675 [Rubricoccaceae bacterium]|jgi:hypothetical protein